MKWKTLLVNASFSILDNQDTKLTLLLLAQQQKEYIFVDSADSCEKRLSISCHIVMQSSSHAECLFVFMHAQDVVLHVDIDAYDDNSTANIVILYALDKKQNITITTQQKHIGRNTKSSVIARGIIQDQSRVTYHGLIQMLPGSMSADAKQEHTTIVLHPQAKVISVPSIEVSHHDVQCLHGSAIGKFQEEQMWYLESRGLSRAIAYRLLVYSFFAEYINQFAGQNKLLESICQKIV